MFQFNQTAENCLTIKTLFHFNDSFSQLILHHVRDTRKQFFVIKFYSLTIQTRDGQKMHVTNETTRAKNT